MSAPASKKQKAGNGDAVAVAVVSEADIEEYLAAAMKLQEAVEQVNKRISVALLDVTA
jgi:hypothetical protein